MRFHGCTSLLLSLAVVHCGGKESPPPAGDGKADAKPTTPEPAEPAATKSAKTEVAKPPAAPEPAAPALPVATKVDDPEVQRSVCEHVLAVARKELGHEKERDAEIEKKAVEACIEGIEREQEKYGLVFGALAECVYKADTLTEIGACEDRIGKTKGKEGKTPTLAIDEPIVTAELCAHIWHLSEAASIENDKDEFFEECARDLAKSREEWGNEIFDSAARCFMDAKSKAAGMQCILDAQEKHAAESKTEDAEQEAAPSGGSLPEAKREENFESALASAQAFEKAMCACKDEPCRTATSYSFTAWGTKNGKLELEEAQEKLLETVLGAMLDCMLGNDPKKQPPSDSLPPPTEEEMKAWDRKDPEAEAKLDAWDAERTAMHEGYWKDLRCFHYLLEKEMKGKSAKASQEYVRKHVVAANTWQQNVFVEHPRILEKSRLVGSYLEAHELLMQGYVKGYREGGDELKKANAHWVLISEKVRRRFEAIGATKPEAIGADDEKACRELLDAEPSAKNKPRRAAPI